MGGLRFKLDEEGGFLDADSSKAAPPITSLRTLEEAGLHLEDEDATEDPGFSTWLNLLMSPGSSLGGARPKASVRLIPGGNYGSRNFPAEKDERDIGGWEMVVNELAIKAGLYVAEGKAKKFTQDNHTFLTKRFDRIKDKRIHFASAMTLLGHTDGTNGSAVFPICTLQNSLCGIAARLIKILKNSGEGSYSILQSATVMII